MKLAIFGATGWIGGIITREALDRGHTVTAIVRDLSRLKLSDDRLMAKTGDVTDALSVAAAVAGHEAVGASIGGRRDAAHEIVPKAARAVLSGLSQSGVKRLVWVGGAGSLEVTPGVALIDTPEFPPDYLPEATPMVEALRIFRASAEAVDWTFISPAVIIAPGTRTGRYRVGGDRLLSDEKGESRISVEDFAVAFVDELEGSSHLRQRIGVAY